MNYELLPVPGEERLSEECEHFVSLGRIWHVHMARKRLLLGVVLTLLLIAVVSSCTIASPLFASAALAALAIFYLVLHRPWLATMFVFLGAGLPSLLFPVPGHTVRPVEATLFLCFVLIILLRPTARLKIPHVLALLFFAVAIISFIHAPEISTSSNVFGANKRVYDLAVILLALFCGTFLVEYIADMSSFLVTVLLSNIPLYLIALAQALGIPLPTLLSPNQNPMLTGDGGRLVGPFSGAAEFGIYLTSLFAVALSCWLLGTRKRDRNVGALMTFMTVLALVGSGTRSALIAMAIMLCAALFITRRFKAFCGVIVLAVAGFAAFPNIILSHFTHAQTSTSNRLFLWGEAVKLIVNNPIIGIGLEQFHYYYNRLIISQSTQLNQHGISVHNQYLEWGMEGGIPWLILGILFLVSIVVVCVHYYRFARQEQRLLLLAAILAVGATIVIGFLDVPFDNVEGGVFLCMLAGMALASTVRITRKEK